MKIEKNVKKSVKIALIFLGIGLLLGTLIVFAATPSSTFYISSGIYPGAPSYTIWKEGNNYFAKDANGLIAYSGTNARQIIENVRDARRSNKGGTIYIRGSTTPYKIDTTLVFGNTDKYIKIIGDGTGQNGTHLKLADNANCNMFNLSDATMFQLENLRLDGNKANNAEGTGLWTGYATGLLPTPDILITHCFIHSFAKDGIYWRDAWGSELTDSYIEANGQYGARLYGYNYLIKGNTFNWNEEYGLYISGDGGGILIVGNAVTENYKHGIYVHSGYYVTITGNIIRGNGHSSNNTYDGIFVSSGNDHLTITGNAIDGKTHKAITPHVAVTRYGIKIESAETTVIGNTISNCVTDEIGSIAGVILEGNEGYVTENSGSASGATGFTVTHGLAETPTGVTITPTTNAGNFYVSTVATTTFTITFDGGGTVTFYWYAEYQP